jgi:hypothetical protein
MLTLSHGGGHLGFLIKQKKSNFSPSFIIPNAPISRAYSPSSTVVFSPADPNQTQSTDQTPFKIPSTAPSSSSSKFCYIQHFVLLFNFGQSLGMMKDGEEHMSDPRKKTTDVITFVIKGTWK